MGVHGENVKKHQKASAERMKVDRAALNSAIASAESYIKELELETSAFRNGKLVPGKLVEQMITHNEQKRAQEASANRWLRETLEDQMHESAEARCQSEILAKELADVEQEPRAVAEVQSEILAKELADVEQEPRAVAEVLLAEVQELQARAWAQEAKEAAEPDGLPMAPAHATTVNSIIDGLVIDDAAAADGQPPSAGLLAGLRADCEEQESWLSSLSFDAIVRDALLKRVREKAPPGTSMPKREQAFALQLSAAEGSRDLVVALLRETPVLYQIADQIVAKAAAQQSSLALRGRLQGESGS